MADEVIIEEYSSSGLETGTPEYANKQVPRGMLTSQVLTIGTRSAAFNANTALIRIQSKGTGFWYKVGATDVGAAANTDGNSWLPADQFRDIALNASDVKIDTAGA